MRTCLPGSSTASKDSIASGGVEQREGEEFRGQNSSARARARKGETEERSNKKAEFIAVMKRAVGDSDAVPRSSG
jgi:hypothetical protein